MKEPKQIVEFTYNYVLKKLDSDKEKLDYYLEEWKYRKPKDLNELFKNMLMHAQNRQGMPKSIGEIENIREFLFNFEPKEVYKYYNTWEEIFNKIENNYKPPGRMDITNTRSYWVIFCKSIYSISKYLSRFSSLEDYNVYVNQFINSKNVDSLISLPLLLSEEIFGYRFALACDFFKENISPEFIKPDTHINKIFKGIGICKQNDTDFEVYRNVVKFSHQADKKPYWVDKLFWLVGSKTFYKNKKYDMEQKVKTSKEELVSLINNLKGAL